MTGLVALDIFIGLVFIYLLYSLLATVVVEILASKLGLRARNLQQAIVRMLSDQEVDGYFSGFKRLLSKNEGLDQKSLAKLFYQSPGIKYLSANSLYSKPSAISSDHFTENLLYVLAKGSNGDQLSDRIKNNLNDGRQDLWSSDLPVTGEETTKEDTLEYLRFLWDISGSDIENFKSQLKRWFEENMERATGWYKKKIQAWLLLVGLLIAMFFNVDTFQIVSKLSTDTKARDQLVQLANSISGGDFEDKKEEILDSLLLKMAFEEPIYIQGYKRGGNENGTDPIESEKDGLEIPIDTLGGGAAESEKDSVSQSGKELENDKPTESYEAERDDGGQPVNAEGDDEDDTPRYIRFFFSDLDNFLGCLVTAIAISLGSSFWFDLLNRLMQLRSSLVKRKPDPSDTSANPTTKPVG